MGWSGLLLEGVQDGFCLNIAEKLFVGENHGEIRNFDVITDSR